MLFYFFLVEFAISISSKAFFFVLQELKISAAKPRENRLVGFNNPILYHMACSC